MTGKVRAIKGRCRQRTTAEFLREIGAAEPRSAPGPWRVTVEYFHAEGSLDAYIAKLLEAKMRLIATVEAEEVPDTSILADVEASLRSLAPALIEEVRLARAAGAGSASDVERLIASRPRIAAPATPIEATGVWEFKSERDTSQTYRVTYGRAGHLECSCRGFEFRGNCKHVREVREKQAA